MEVPSVSANDLRNYLLKNIFILMLFLPWSPAWSMECEVQNYPETPPKSMGVGMTVEENGKYRLNILACSNPSDCKKMITFENSSYASYDHIGYYLVKDWEGALSDLPERIKRKDEIRNGMSCGCPDFKTSIYNLDFYHSGSIPNAEKFTTGPMLKNLSCFSRGFFNLLENLSSAKSVIFGRFEKINETYYLKVDAGSNTKISTLKLKNPKKMDYANKGLLHKPFVLFTNQAITGEEKEIDSIPLCDSIFDVSESSGIELLDFDGKNYFFHGTYGKLKDGKIKMKYGLNVFDHKMNDRLKKLAGEYFVPLTNELKYEQSKEELKKKSISYGPRQYGGDRWFKMRVDQYKDGDLNSKIKRYYDDFFAHNMINDFRKSKAHELESMFQEKYVKDALLVRIGIENDQYYFDVQLGWNGIKKERYGVEHFSMSNEKLGELNSAIHERKLEEKVTYYLLLTGNPIKIKNGRMTLPRDYIFKAMGNDNYEELDQIFAKYFKRE